MTAPQTNGFRLGVYVFKDVEIIDFAAPYGVFSVARRFDPELDAFLIADAARPVQAQAGFTVLPNYSFNDCPTMDAFLIPGGFGTRQEMHNRRLHQFVRSLPEATLLTSVCTGSWVYGRMGLLDGVRALTERGFITGASARNWAGYGHEVVLPDGFAREDEALLTDPQTSGGLLVSCAPKALDEVLSVFRRHGFERAAAIGEIAGSATPRLVVR